MTPSDHGDVYIYKSPDTGKLYVLFARCDRHATVPQLNAALNAISECGACIGEETAEAYVLILDLLDGYAHRLTHHAVLRAKLAQARDRLNLLSPGAGDFLEADNDEAD